MNFSTLTNTKIESARSYEKRHVKSFATKGISRAAASISPLKNSSKTPMK